MAEEKIEQEKRNLQKRLHLEMIGSDWFLEVDGKLNRLKFLTNEKNVRLQGNVIFADESLYQVYVDNKNNVKLIKIEEIDQRSMKGIFAAPLEYNSEELGNSKTDTCGDIRSITLESKKDDESENGEDNTYEIQEMGQDEYISDSEEKGDVKQQDEAHTITVIAAHDFQAHLDDEITFMKGELLTVDSEPFSKDYNIWVPATHLKTGQTGFIPRRFVNRNVKSPVFESWWFNVNGVEAEKLLLSSCFKSGTFLIRNSEDDTSLALSLKSIFHETGNCKVVHYLIQRLEKEKVAFPPTMFFENILELISFYRINVAMRCKLEKQCPKDEPTVEFRDLETTRQSVTIIKELFSVLSPPVAERIYAGKWRDEHVAVKESNRSQTMTHHFFTEIEILKNLNCKRVVKLMAVHTKSEPYRIITELMINGPLSNYLRLDIGKSLQLEDLTYVIAQIADGMDYLGRMQIVHRDLRAFNILVGHGSEVKIAQFGLARWLESGIYISFSNADQIFPIRWTSPEAMDEHKFSEKSDVWSFGVVMYEIITFGEKLYSGMTNNEVIECVHNGFRMPKPLVCPNPYYEMMLRCWNKEPESRPTFAYLKEYFSDYKACAQNDCVTHL